VLVLVLVLLLYLCTMLLCQCTMLVYHIILLLLLLRLRRWLLLLHVEADAGRSAGHEERPLLEDHWPPAATTTASDISTATAAAAAGSPQCLLPIQGVNTAAVDALAQLRRRRPPPMPVLGLVPEEQCLPRHQTEIEPSFLKFTDIL